MTKEETMNHCDHGHATEGAIRRLPIGGSANVLGGSANVFVCLCHGHYQIEMEFRRERARQTGADKWDFPRWLDLDVDQPGPEK